MATVTHSKDPQVQNLIQKVCPVLLRSKNGITEILLFKHPVGQDIQLVKGTVEKDETPECAVLRELEEESGITNATITRKLGTIPLPNQNQIWETFLIRSEKPLPDRWTFYAQEAGGQNFDFFWQDIEIDLESLWEGLFEVAIKEIRTLL